MFCAKALERGAPLGSEDEELLWRKAIFSVDDVWTGLQILPSPASVTIRLRLEGSNGKRLPGAFAAGAQAIQTLAISEFNNHIGVPLTCYGEPGKAMIANHRNGANSKVTSRALWYRPSITQWFIWIGKLNLRRRRLKFWNRTELFKHLIANGRCVLIPKTRFLSNWIKRSPPDFVPQRRICEVEFRDLIHLWSFGEGFGYSLSYTRWSSL